MGLKTPQEYVQSLRALKISAAYQYRCKMAENVLYGTDDVQGIALKRG